MTDFFKSALGGMFGNSQANGGPGLHAQNNNNLNTNSNSHSNEFVGQNIIIGSYRLKITRLIAEGGFAIVYLAVDPSTGKDYALKRIFAADDTSNKAIRDEIGYLKKVVNHPNLIHFIAAACEESEQSRFKEFLILTELCKDPLIDHLRAGLSSPRGRAFDSEQVLQIFYQICRSVQYLHAQEPCIIHRDLKLENFLVSKTNQIKLCDFGSATTEVYRPDNSWSVNKRNLIEDEIAKQTTPMYRAPEMLDLYNNYIIDSQVDIWALGCVLFVLCFNRHPFEDAAKLRIINGKYQIPSTDKDFTEFHDIIRCMLQINPSDRPNINEVMFHLENIAQSKSTSLNENLSFLKKTESMSVSNNQSSENFASNESNMQNQAATVNTAGQTSASQSGWIGNAANMFKGNSFMSTIKAASNKVIEGVQSMNKGELDLTYITSRLIVMSCPTEGIESAAFGNNIDQIKEALESKHNKAYRIYNLANRQYKKEKFSQVIDLGANLSSNRAPPISLMCKLCANILKFLNENPNNVCVINCNDGRVISGIAVATLFMYCDLIRNLDSCLNLFSAKRGAIALTSIQYEYLKDTQRLFASFRNELNREFSLSPNECLISSLVLIGVPLFNRQRNGCTPYIEIFNKDKKIYTNLTDYALMKKYVAKEGQIMIPINCHKFYGEITIMLFHAKSLLGTEKVTSTKIFQLQFHTAFIAQHLADQRQISFKKESLDGLDSSEKYPDSFQVVLNMDLKSSPSPLASDEPWTNRAQFDSMLPKTPQAILFNDANEMERIVHIFDSASKVYSDDTFKQRPVEENGSFTSYLGKNQQSEPTQENFTSYLNVNQYGTVDDNSSTKSSRSNSPMPNQAQSKQANTLLLDFDDDSDASSSHQDSQKQNRLNNDFQLLLDLDDQSQESSNKPQKSTTTSTNTNTNNIFDDDFFSATAPAPTPASTASNMTASKPNDLDDLFGSISQPIQQPSTNASSKSNMTFDPFESLIKPTPAATQKPTNFSNNNSFDPFSNLTSNILLNKNTPLNSSKNNNSGSNLFNMSNNNTANKPTDPFSNLTTFGSSNNSSSQNNVNTPTVSSKPSTPTPSVKNNMKFGTSANYNVNTSNQQKPHGNFNFMTSAGTNSGGASSAFDDFLPSSFAKNREQANMTLKDMQREVNAKDIDPNKLKVMEWTDGKKANIRALLCSLHKVLWEGETKWEPCGMQQLVSANDVKKMYRKAVLAVHPDKLTDHPEIELARLIFVELNDAWARFQNEGQKNLF